MKNGKNPKVRESNHIKSCGLTPTNWFISKKTKDMWLLVHRFTGQKREIPSR